VARMLSASSVIAENDWRLNIPRGRSEAINSTLGPWWESPFGPDGESHWRSTSSSTCSGRWR